MRGQSMKKLSCPHCTGGELRRLNRIGFIERRVLCSLGIFPWECVLCRKKTYRRNDGHVDLAKREAERLAARESTAQASRV
jgi:hypothetical protein